MFGFRKKAKPLAMMIEPTWDGEHRLTNILVATPIPGFRESTGYRWVCSCTAISRLSPTEWYDSEELAAQGHAKHRHAYESAKPKWGPRPEYFEYPPQGKHG